MDTTKLRAFLEICSTGSFSKAAERFSYTPSAFSHMIDGLENDFGVKLFLRTHKGVKLTKQGELIYNDVVRVVDAERLLKSSLERIKSENDVKICTYSSVAHFILPEIIRDYKKINGKVKFSIQIIDRLKDAIEKGTADVYFGDAIAYTADTECFPILKDEYVAVVPSSEFKGRRSINREELYPYPYIKSNETILQEVFRDENFKEIVNYTSVEDFSILTMVSKNIGVSVTNSLVARERVKGVKVLGLVPKLYRTIGVTYGKDTTQEAKRFISYLKERFKDQKVDSAP